MKPLCIIEKIFNNHSLYSFSVFDCSKNYHIISDKFETNNYTKACFDIFKILKFYDLKNEIIYDVKSLYELDLTQRFENLIQLSEHVLGEQKTRKYKELSNKIKSHIKSYKITKIDITSFDIQDLFPENLGNKLYEERAKLIYELYNNFNNKDIVNFYDNFFFKQLKTLNKVKNNKIETIGKGELNLEFSPSGSRNGRIGFKKKCINIYNLPKNKRNFIIASEKSSIVSFDFVSFQPRISIYLSGDKELKNKINNLEDIYSLFSGQREKRKIELISWMFSNYSHYEFDNILKPIRDYRKKIFDISKECGSINNLYGRQIKHNNEEENVFFHNFIASTETDMMFSIMTWLNDYLENNKDIEAKNLFPFYDSLVMEISDSDMELIYFIKDKMETFYKDIFNNEDVFFPVNIKIGSNFADLEKIEHART